MYRLLINQDLRPTCRVFAKDEHEITYFINCFISLSVGYETHMKGEFEKQDLPLDTAEFIYVRGGHEILVRIKNLNTK